MAITTSTDNTGLIGKINRPFELKYGAKVHVLAVGTGKALRLAENGDVDLVLVHAPNAELEFVNKGYGIGRTAVMHNDFVLLGPKDDPARVKDKDNISDAFSNIASTSSYFVSRGDDSGTHKKEKNIWSMAGIEGINPELPWYLSIGQGMGMAIMVANEKLAYVLSDRGTYLAYRNKIDLDILAEGDQILHNPYHIILVNPEKHPHIKVELAQKYIDSITGPEGQKIIRDFRINGHLLFHPDVITNNY
ncbi:MAG: substrate-binding domain-containing protein [Gammaproteobacteria bacterium]